MNQPYFSIIIPCLNEEAYLPLLLTNLAEQTFKDFEVIVVDGGSKDSTVNKAQAYKKDFPLTIIESKKRHVSHQRNVGAAAAKAPILIFFDADTKIPKNFLKKVKDGFEEKKPHLLTTWVKADDSSQTARFIATGTNMLFEIIRFLGVPGAYGAMIAIRRKVFEDIGGFDETTAFGEDTQLIQKGVEENFKYIILKNVSYQFSLRRFRKEGTLEAALQYLRLNLAIVRNGFHGPHPEYPMGGHLFNDVTTKKSQLEFLNQKSLRWFETTFQRLPEEAKKQRQKFATFMKDLLSDLPQID